MKRKDKVTKLNTERKVSTEKEVELGSGKDPFVGMSERELNTPVTRGEFISVLEQVSANIKEITNYITEDMNHLFQRFTYPNNLKLMAVMNLLDSKEVISKQDIENETQRIYEEAVQRAKEESEVVSGDSSGTKEEESKTVDTSTTNVVDFKKKEN